MLEAVQLNMRLHGQITVCGMISQYNLEQQEGVCNLLCLLPKRVRIEAFIVTDYFGEYSKFEEEMVRYLKEDPIQSNKSVIRL